MSLLEKLFGSILGKLGTIGVLTWVAVYVNQHLLNSFFSQEQIATAVAGAVAWLIAHGIIKGAQASVPPEVAKMLHEGTSPEVADKLARSFPSPVVVNAPQAPPANVGGG